MTSLLKLLFTSIKITQLLSIQIVKSSSVVATPPLNFSLSENFFPKIQNLGLNIPHFGGI